MELTEEDVPALEQSATSPSPESIAHIQDQLAMMCEVHRLAEARADRWEAKYKRAVAEAGRLREKLLKLGKGRHGAAEMALAFVKSDQARMADMGAWLLDGGFDHE